MTGSDAPLAQSRVDFIIAGPQGTGEDWLAAQLRSHPRIRLLSKAQPLASVPGAWAPQRSDAVATAPADASVPIGWLDHRVASLEPSAQAALVRRWPNIRLIFTFRAPQQRALAAAAQALQIAQLQPHEVSETWLRDWLGCAFQQRQRDYRGMLAGWRRLLGPRQMQVVCFEQVLADPDAAIAACCRFLRLKSTGLAVRPYDRRGEARRIDRLLPPDGDLRRLVCTGANAEGMPSDSLAALLGCDDAAWRHDG